MKILTTLICLFLAGCGSEEGRDNYGYGWHYDVQGESGLRVRYLQGQTTPSLDEIERVYRVTMACTGLHATGPLVIFVEDQVSNGYIYFDTGTVTIKAHIYGATTATLMHEFVHHLLHQSGFPVTANSNHQSQLFTDCTVPA